MVVSEEMAEAQIGLLLLNPIGEDNRAQSALWKPRLWSGTTHDGQSENERLLLAMVALIRVLLTARSRSVDLARATCINDLPG